MPRPNFTGEEQYLISTMRGDVKDTSAFLWTYLFSGALIAVCAALYDNTWMMLSALVVVSGTRLYEEWWQAKWKPVARSVILKYEAAIAAEAEGPEGRQQ